MGTRIRNLLIAMAASAGATLAAAQGATTYVLDGDSAFAQGCYPPCLCPIQIFEDLQGTFELSFVNATPDGFDHWSVDAVSWVVTGGGQTLVVTGTGQYDRGGAVALLERLQLDLSIDGGSVEHFDSGLLPGGADFPRIDLTVSINGMVCFDKVFDVRAGPATLGRSYCAANVNSSGLAATIAAAGSPSVADDDLLLIAHGAPPGMPGLFFFGPGTTQTPFGDGFLCVAGGLVRLSPPLAINGDGNALRPVPLTVPPAAGLLLPGTSWSFQFWYRDPAGGPAGFNLSDAVRVDFL